MSFKIKEKKEHNINPNYDQKGLDFRETLSQIVQSYASIFTIKKKPDIYSGKENIPFDQRHPIFKSIMRLEFQDDIRLFERK